jgi:hypothetical protein
MRFRENGGGIGLLEVSDISGQKRAAVRDAPTDATVGELIEGLLSDMRLNQTDSEGRPLTYQVRLEREGRHLLGSERLGDALKSGDQLVLQPNIDAGGQDPGARR